MALNLNNLPDYIKEGSQELLVKSIMTAKTIDFLKNQGSLIVGVKGTQTINLLDADVNLQENDGCGRTPVGEVKFSQAKITVTPLKDEQSYCPKSYEKKFTVEYLTQGQTYSELLYAQDFMSLRASKLAEANEKIVWLGDTDSTNRNLNKFDGWVKILGDVEALPAGNGLLERLQQAVIQIPTEIKSASDFVLFMSEEDHLALNIELANKNIYKATDDFTLFGTNVKIQPTPGLNGTDKFYFGRTRSFVIGCDLTGEDESALMEYDTHSKLINIDFYYALGVSMVYQDEVYGFSKNTGGAGSSSGE